ncbi:MAG: NrsF family protein [Acidobacteriota bacterium]
MTEPRVSPALRDAIARDLEPVQPFPAPWRRVLRFAPIGLFLVAASPLYWGWRENLQALPGWISWGLSGLQALVGLMIVGAALREAVPGRTLSSRALVAVFAGGLSIVVGTTLATAIALPVEVPPGDRLRWIWECFDMAAAIGVPALAIVGWLVWRMCPSRPAVAGALCGLGAGVLTDAGVRLFCRVDQSEHILLAHGGEIVALVVLGAAVSVAIDRFRR